MEGAEGDICLQAENADAPSRTVYTTDAAAPNDGHSARFAHRVPLVYLAKGDSLRMTVHVRRGCGRMHARYAPAVVWHRSDGADATALYIQTHGAMRNEEILRVALEHVRRMVDRAEREADRPQEDRVADRKN